MRPLKGTLSAPSGSLARVSVPTVSVRVQCLACARLSLALGARQLWPWRNPAAERVIAICSLAAAERVKWTLVPLGVFPAEIAVTCLPTRKRLFVRLAAVIVGGAGVVALAGAVALAVCSARVLKVRSEPMLLPPWLVAEILRAKQGWWPGSEVRVPAKSVEHRC